MKFYEKWQKNYFSPRRIINPKHEIPAFAEAASRRQAQFETISNDQIPNVQNKKSFRKFKF